MYHSELNVLIGDGDGCRFAVLLEDLNLRTE